jgi:hypothetical protein
MSWQNENIFKNYTHPITITSDTEEQGGKLKTRQHTLVSSFIQDFTGDQQKLWSERKTILKN